MGPLLIKGLVIAGGVGISSLGAWGAYELFKPRTIREKMEWQGEKFPTVEGDSDLDKWKKLAEANDKASDNQVDEVKNTTDNGDDNAKAKKMRDKCKELLNKKLGDASDADYPKAKRCALSSIPAEGTTT